MPKVVCSAKIESEPMRNAIMAWVEGIANGGYRVEGDTIHMTYHEILDDPDNHSRKWAIIHYFEMFPEHSIECIA